MEFRSLLVVGFVVKLVLMATMAPPVASSLFLPFIDFFATHPLGNPYQEFFNQGKFDSFPYSSVMLWLYGLPSMLVRFLSTTLYTTFSGFWPKLTILAFDYLSLLTLMALLPAYRTRLLYFWWLNPIVCYICYFHGQLDILPTAALLGGLTLLFSGREVLAFMIIGLGLGMKAHLFAALPFLMFFVYFRHFSVPRALGMIGLALFIFGVLQVPYWSEGYLNLVLFEKMSLRLFALNFPFDEKGRAFLFAPAVVLFLFYRFVSFRTTNRDTLLLTLGLLYAAMVSVVPPTPGWFLWSMPFLVYFFVKYRETSSLSFFSLIGFYLLYQLVDQQSDIPAVFSKILPHQDRSTTFYQMLVNWGVNAQRIENCVFTALECALLMNVVWVYKVGISSSNLARRLKQNFRIGICGDSGSGKSRLTDALISLFGRKDVLVVAGDDLHKWERGHENWKSQTHLDPKSNRLHDEVEHAERLQAGHNVKRAFYDHKTGKFTSVKPIESKPFIVFQGLHTFFLERMRNMMHVKIFLDPDKSLRYYWKIKRDIAHRGYTKEQVMDQLLRREPDSQKYIESQKNHADVIIRCMLTHPTLDVETMLGMSEIPIKLQLELNADVNIEGLVQCLKNVASLESDYWFVPDRGRVVLECEGEISSEQVGELAKKLIIEYQELVGYSPEWRSGYEGIVQLLMLLVLGHFYAERRRA